MTEFIGILVPLTIGLVELVKRAEVMPKKYLPLFALLFGIMFAYFTRSIGADFGEIIMDGIIVGLTASGLFSTSKNLIQKREKLTENI